MYPIKDELQDLMYIRTRKRSLGGTSDGHLEEKLEFSKIGFERTDKNEFTFANLEHYSAYEITVRACRKNVSNETLGQANDLCSRENQIITKTMESETADEIKVFQVNLMPSNTSTHDIKLSWEPPTNPNGFILNYDVKLIKIDETTNTPEVICISLMERTNITSQVIDRLEPGNYSVQILAVTLVGKGNYTSPSYVYIPSVSHFSLITSPSLMTLVIFIFLSVGIILVYTAYKRKHKQRMQDITRLSAFESEDPFDH